MKVFKKILWLVLIMIIIAQFFGPDKNEGEWSSLDAFIAETNPPEQVQVILKESCYDCHSDVTRYPWYSVITPVNYWMDDHVRHGKGHFNVSQWENNSTKKKDHKFEELIDMVENRGMPLNSYIWAHREAKLTDEERQALIDWAEGVRFKYSLEPRPE